MRFAQSLSGVARLRQYYSTTSEDPHARLSRANALSAARGTLIALIAVLFFSGIDRAILYFVIPEFVQIDWLEQVYRVFSMVIFGLSGLRYVLAPLCLATINLAILPFNGVSAFVNRAHAGFWLGFCGRPVELERLVPLVGVAATVGAVSIFLDYLYIATYWHRLAPAGLFENTSFAMPLALAILVANSRRDDHLLSGVLLAACVMTGSRAVWATGLFCLLVTLRLGSSRALMVAFSIVALLLSHPNSHRLAVLSKTANITYEISTALPILRNDLPRSSNGHRPTSASERVAGINVLRDLGWRGLFPFSQVRPNDVGHMGFVLYVSIYGYILGFIYAAVAFRHVCLLPFFLVAVLSVFYTDPILSFGVGILLLQMFGRQVEGVTERLRVAPMIGPAATRQTPFAKTFDLCRYKQLGEGRQTSDLRAGPGSVRA